MIAKKMAAHSVSISLPLYNTLYELMIDDISRQILRTHHKEPTHEVTIRWPGFCSAFCCPKISFYQF
jgi:hypothetical protein